MTHMTVVETEIDAYMVIGIKIKEGNMVATIYKGFDSDYFAIKITDGNSICFDAWRKKYDSDYIVTNAKDLYETMWEIFSWSVDEMREICVFCLG